MARYGKHPDDDLFAGTTMTFGEHLEELRGTLFRALIGVMIGFLLGLAVGKHVVGFIKTPLESALQDYYVDQALVRLEDPYRKDFTDEEWEGFREFVAENQFTFEEVYLERTLLERLLADSDNPRETPQAAAPAVEASEPTELGAAMQPQFLPTPERDMVKTRMWRKVATQVKTMNAQEAFMIWMKASFIFGFILASPWVFYQVWSFIAAGLYPHEKRYVHFFLPFSLGLFLSGAALAFFFVFEPVLDFLLSFNATLGIDPDPRISEWIGFVLFLPLGFGISFQLPLVMLFLNRLGIISLDVYLEKWRIAILVIFVVAMVLTPADPISMMLMAGPLTLLYFLGLALCKWLPRNRSPYDEAYEPGEMVGSKK